MSRKSKNPWLICEKCNYHFIKNDFETHTCPLINQKPNHTYIFINTFYCLLEISQKPPENLTFSEKQSLAFLSPYVIDICNFQVGQHILIESQDLRIIKQIWPSAEKHHCCLLHKDSINLYRNILQKYVKITPLNETPQPALEVYIKLSDLSEITNDLRYILINNFNGRIVREDENILLWYYGENINIKIEKIISSKKDKNIFKINEKTIWKLNKKNLEIGKKEKKEIIFGGYEEIFKEMLDMINLGLYNAPKFERFNYRSFLIYGPSGSGKTTLTHKLIEQSKTYAIYIQGTQLYSKFYGETEKKLSEIFSEAENKSPSIVIIEDIDLLCPKAFLNITDQQKRITSTLSTLLDNATKKSRIMIIATTLRPDEIDHSLRRSGRFDREFELSTPDPNCRFQILKALLYNDKCQIPDEKLRKVANKSHGFVAADLVLLYTKAKAHAVINSDLSSLTAKNLFWALDLVKPSAMREILIQVPNVKWSDIGGQDDLKQLLEQAILWPMKYPDILKKHGLNSPKGFLMFGPPGCSKTMIAKALATESKLNFLSLKCSELFNKWLGESERAIRELFKRARQVSPSIVFLDEMDAIAGQRSDSSHQGGTDVQSRVSIQLLTELDGIETLKDVIVVGATNRPDLIDPALLRPGRLGLTIYVPLPDDKVRREIFNIKLSKMSVSQDVLLNIVELVKITNGFSGAEIHNLCQHAGIKTLEENIESVQIELDHFYKALESVYPKTPNYLLEIYEKFINK